MAHKPFFKATLIQISLTLLAAGSLFAAEQSTKKQFTPDSVDASLQDINALDNDIASLLNKTNTTELAENTDEKPGFDHHADELFTRDDYRHAHETMSPFDHASAYESKQALKIAHGDYALTFGGSSKIENYVQKNNTLLNSEIPDESLYYKNALDFTINYAYGEKHFGHKAIDAYLDLMHKGVWGKNITAADPTKLDLTDPLTTTIFGDHKHPSTRPFIWFREAWLQLSLTAIAAPHSKKLHFLKLGWFPFQLGRGIALGSAYGLTRDSSGLYSAAEDKCAPGINFSGELIKDAVKYDLYYSMLECRSKGLGDTLEAMRLNQPDTILAPWRGKDKNNEVFAARLKIKPVLEKQYGTLDVEPYILYNSASDQTVEVLYDTNTRLGTVGLALEQTWNDFEWGGEFAFNFGSQTLCKLDRNTTKIVRDPATGNLLLQYTKVNNGANKALATDEIATAVRKNTVDNKASFNTESGSPITLTNAADRYRDKYTNSFKGCMGVFDIGYTINPISLRLATGVGYVSGDRSTLLNKTDKAYNGFVSIGEVYSGTRVKSQFVLDERCLQRPFIKSTTENSVSIGSDVSFSDLTLCGVSALWTPKLNHKKVACHANTIVFWQNHKDDKFTLDNTGAATFIDGVYTRNFLGTEVNLLNSIELLRDLNLFVKCAVFVPGSYFQDVKGIPMKNDAFSLLYDSGTGDQAIENAKKYRLSTDVAYHLNVGLSFKF